MAAQTAARERLIWSIDEYIVVADLYLRRGRSSGVGDPEVIELSQLTGRTPASISRRLGNFDGTARPGMGLKPVTGDPLAMFQSMQRDDLLRERVAREARMRLSRPGGSNQALVSTVPCLVDPEECLIETGQVTSPPATREMVRAEAQLVRRYRQWLDPSGKRLRGVLIETPTDLLRADLYDTLTGRLIEAKAEASRENLRYAIGQLI